MRKNRFFLFYLRFLFMFDSPSHVLFVLASSSCMSLSAFNRWNAIDALRVTLRVRAK